MKKLSLMEVLGEIEDTRRNRSVIYPLHEVLIIMLLAVICGATSYAKVEMFGKSKREWLGTFLELENGIPDACTFRNVIKEIDTQKLHLLFCECMKSVVKELYGVVAIDGKQARRTKDAKKRPLHVVSAFSVEYGVVLGQLACEEKSNEITAIPKLLKMLEIKGCIVTIDAMGTQTEIAKSIIWLEIIKPCYYKEERGNKPYDLELMLQIHILQNLYDLSDMRVMTEVIDSRAFSEFCRVDSSNQVPNGDTIGKFRNILVKNGIQEKLFLQVVVELGFEKRNNRRFNYYCCSIFNQKQGEKAR